MRVMQLVVLYFGMAGLAVLAAEPGTRQVQSIPIEYVSPGASGSLGASSNHQRYEAYAGYAGSTRSEAYGSSSVQQRGGIRQGIRYPGGFEVQRYPRQIPDEQQRRR